MLKDFAIAILYSLFMNRICALVICEHIGCVGSYISSAVIIILVAL